MKQYGNKLDLNMSFKHNMLISMFLNTRYCCLELAFVLISGPYQCWPDAVVLLLETNLLCMCYSIYNYTIRESSNDSVVNDIIN